MLSSSHTPKTSTLALLLCGLVAFAACGGEDQFPAIAGHDPGKVTPPAGTKCEDGESRGCSITLGNHAGVLSCYHGTQSCVNGGWQPCTDGEVREQAAPAYLSGKSLRAMAISTPVDCVDNPCDPFCQTYEEEPENPLEPENEDPIYNWFVGDETSLESFPGGLVEKGLIEPCTTGYDCQFNMYCEAPSSMGCTHSVCESGDALGSTCNSCAELVCAEDATCCTGAPSDVSACDHDPCLVGEGLVSTCNSCVQTICAAMPSCCVTTGNNTNWTATCVAAVESLCGNSCGCNSGEVLENDRCYYYETTDKDWEDARDDCEDRGSGWSLAAINDATENQFLAAWNSDAEKFIGLYESNNGTGTWTWANNASLGSFDEDDDSVTNSLYVNWQGTEPIQADDPDCAYMDDTTGDWVGETACNSTVATDMRDSVCEGPKGVMFQAAGAGNSWTSDCVDLAESVCDVRCDEDDPSNDAGECVPWFPTQTDPNCAGVDLAVGITCGAVIPVCNHGNTTALPPIALSHYPANSQQYPTCAPGGHANQVNCTIYEAIPPGECVMVDQAECFDLMNNQTNLGGNREIMVNPDGDQINTADGYVDECSCLDNWSLFSTVADAQCEVASCAGDTVAAAEVLKPIDIVVIVDNSYSMDERIEEVQSILYSDMAQILEDSGLDYRVILVSRFGDVDTDVGTSPNPICIPTPLGGNACTDAANETLVNNTNFYHYSAEIESWDSWCQLLYGYDHGDEIGTTDWTPFQYGTARTWTSLAPNGWSDWLREDAFKHFVVITDDDIDCSDYGYDFDDSPDCEFFPHDCHDLTTQEVPTSSVTAGEAAAQDFDDELLGMSSAQFGTASERNYMWHSIINIQEHPDGATVAWQANEGMQTKMCTPTNTSIVGAGTGYQALSILTGGLRYPICDSDNFDTIFNAIAASAVETSGATCSFSLDAAGDLDPEKASVVWTDGSNVTTTLEQVNSLGDCGTSTSSWYYDDPVTPTLLSLCPETCATVQADSDAEVSFQIECVMNPSVTTASETYVANCAADEIPQWSFLFYDTTIPGGTDATVSFQVRAAATQDDLVYETWVDVATATADAPDCAKNAPVDGVCPVDLYTLLGAPANSEQYVEVQVTLTPGSNYETPSVENWELTYSCPPGE